MSDVREGAKKTAFSFSVAVFPWSSTVADRDRFWWRMAVIREVGEEGEKVEDTTHCLKRGRGPSGRRKRRREKGSRHSQTDSK